MTENTAPWPSPKNEDELHAWIRETLGLTVPRAARVPGHTAPFEYLVHAFFEGRVRPLISAVTGKPILDCVVWANRGGGKTFLGAVATVLDLVFKPGVEVRILGGSLEQSKRMHAHLRALFSLEPLEPLVAGRITETKLSLTNGSRVELLAQSQASVRGTRPQKLRCDELDLFDPDVWEAAQLTTRSAPTALGTIEGLSTMHRPFGLMRAISSNAEIGPEPGEPERQAVQGVTRRLFKWGIADVLDRSDPDFSCLNDETGACVIWPDCPCHTSTPDEPGGHITLDDAVRLKERVDPTTWNAEMLCLRPRRSDCVYETFDEQTHVIDSEPEANAEWVCGMDFGFRGETAILFGCLDAADVLTIYDERIASGIVVAEHARAIVEAPYPIGGVPKWIAIDPAGQARSGQTGLSDARVLREAGLVVRSRRLALREGIGLVRTRLGSAAGEIRLRIHRRCQGLIEALSTYHYPADRPASEAPVKDGSDHACDALRYLIQNIDRPGGCSKQSYL